MQGQDIVAIDVANRLGILDKLAHSENPMTLQQIAAAVQTEENLVSRIVRHLTSFHAVLEVGEDGHVLGKVGRAFITRKGVAGAQVW